MTPPVSANLSDVALLKQRDASSNTLKNFAGWLRELEHAQWSERQRYHSQHANFGHSKAGKDANEVSHPFRAFTANKFDGYVRKLEKSNESFFVMTGAHAPKIDVAINEAGSDHPINGFGGAGQSIIRLLLGAETNAAVQSRSARSSDLGKVVPWLEFSTHMFINGNELQIWIRDQRLNQTTGLRLLQALRREFSRSGLDLVSMTLNGKKV